MFDINTAINTAIAAAVAEAMLPLQQEYANKMGEMATRIAALEAKLAEAAPAPQVEATTLNALETALQNRVFSVEVAASRLHERTLALEAHTAVLDQHGGILEYLDNQEWFWEKVSRYITNNSDITVDELHNIKERLEKLEAHEDNVYHFDKGAVAFLIAEAINNHEEGMSHLDEDDIDTKIDAAIERHEENRTHGDEDDIEEIVQKLLNSASISISV